MPTRRVCNHGVPEERIARVFRHHPDGRSLLPLDVEESLDTALCVGMRA